MVQSIKNHISVVALGRQNPQILNPDFLEKYSILPNKEPFSSFYKKEGQHFTEFISTPPFTHLVIKNVDFVVDEQRMQIKQVGIDNWTNSSVFDILIKYYKTLPHTPLQVVGVNLNYKIIFDNSSESEKFQKILFSQDHPIARLIKSDSIDTGMELAYSRKDKGRMKIIIGKLQDNFRIVNFNYEFDYKGIDDLELKSKEFGTVSNYCEDLFSSLIKLA
jgi:hypothetical protein